MDLDRKRRKIDKFFHRKISDVVGEVAGAWSDEDDGLGDFFLIKKPTFSMGG